MEGFQLWKFMAGKFSAAKSAGAGMLQNLAYSGGFEWYPLPTPFCESAVNMRVGAMSIAQLANSVFVSNGLRVKS
jgi:hypothetical protein